MGAGGGAGAGVVFSKVGGGSVGVISDLELWGKLHKIYLHLWRRGEEVDNLKWPAGRWWTLGRWSDMCEIVLASILLGGWGGQRGHY